MALYPPLWMQEGTYPANLDRFFIQDALGPGPALLGGVGSFLVSQHAAGANMSVDVAPGRGLVPGTDVTNQGAYSIWSDAVTNVPIANAPGAGQSRIDVIVVQIRDDFVIGGGHSDFVIVPIPGTAAATGSQTVPAIPNSSIAIAQVLVGPSVSSIVTANITDVRPFARGSMSVQTIPAPIAGAPSTVTHNLNTIALSVTLWDTVTSQLVLAQVTTLNANQIQIAVAQSMPNPISVFIIGSVLSAAPVLATDLAPKAYVDARTPNLPGPVTSGSGVQSYTDAVGEVWVAANGVNAGAWRKARDVLHCRYNRVTALTMTAGAWINVPCDGLIFDDYGLYAGSTGIFTPPITGMWRFTWWTGVTATATGQWLQPGVWTWVSGAPGATVAQAFYHSSGAFGLVSGVTFMRRVTTLPDQLVSRVAGSVAFVMQVNGVSTLFEASYVGTG